MHRWLAGGTLRMHTISGALIAIQIPVLPVLSAVARATERLVPNVDGLPRPCKTEAAASEGSLSNIRPSTKCQVPSCKIRRTPVASVPRRGGDVIRNQFVVDARLERDLVVYALMLERVLGVVHALGRDDLESTWNVYNTTAGLPGEKDTYTLRCGVSFFVLQNMKR